MAFMLTPRFAPTYQAPQCSPFGFCAPVSRPSYGYRVARPRPQRPQYSSFNHFFGQVDELLSEIDREAQCQAHLEAQREAHRQRQQRKRALRAKFDVNQTEHGWQIDGDFQGFDQENINIEITDEHTLKISGNTQWQTEKKTALETAQAIEQTNETAIENKVDGVTLNEPEYDTVHDAGSTVETATVGAVTADSDTESHKSNQPTVEDDYEDLGAESSSLISSPSRPLSPTEVQEPKGKEKAVEAPTASEPAAVHQPQVQEPTAQQPQEPQQEDRVHGSFERTFKFPTRIDTESVSASFKDGALKIVVPRAQAQQIKKIAIL